MYKTIAELAKELNIPAHRINYAHVTGALPEVLRVGGRRLYSEEDAQRVKDYFVGKLQKQLQNINH